MKYRVLWLLEIVLGALLLFVLFVPTQDYALREYKEYLRHPSSETLKAFQEKSQEEAQLRGGVAIFLAAAGLVVAIPIFRIRNRNKARQTGQ
ncbi:MAG TPA: hypothetical protein VI431_16800 [Candidatus Acidoferrum sp.]